MNLLRPKIGLATILSPYEVGGQDVQRIEKEANRNLTALGIEVLPGSRIVDSDEDGIAVGMELSQKVDAVCILYGTYADDTYATTVLEQTKVPAIVWGTNQYNTGSIAGAQQLSAVLVEIGRYFKQVYGDVNDNRALKEVLRTARVAAAKRKIANSRVGVIGFPRIKGQTQAAIDEIELRERIGARVVGVGTHFFTRYMDEAIDEEVKRVWKDVSTGIKSINVNQENISEGVRAYLAMKRIVKEKQLDAVAFEDWNDFIGIPNLAFSLLNDEGIPAACEGDVHCAVTLSLLHLLTGGKAAFHGELLGMLAEEDALLVAHYGVGAMSLAESRDKISLEPDRSSKKGVNVVFNFATGPVTVASLTGRKGSYRMLIAPGESIRAPAVFHGGTVANVKFGVNYREFLERAKGMSHHWMVGVGNVSAELVEYCEMCGIKPVLV